MGRITSSGCARNDRITRDEVECDPVVPGAPTRTKRPNPVAVMFSEEFIRGDIAVGEFDTVPV